MAESRFTPETRADLIERFALGLSVAEAARAVGLNEKTLKSWLTRGRREPEGSYGDFVAAVEEARRAARDRPDPMTREEFQQRLDEAVRAGSVQAMKLWDERDRREREPAQQQVSKIASLADARRRWANG